MINGSLQNEIQEGRIGTSICSIKFKHTYSSANQRIFKRNECKFSNRQEQKQNWTRIKKKKWNLNTNITHFNIKQQNCCKPTLNFKFISFVVFQFWYLCFSSEWCLIHQLEIVVLFVKLMIFDQQEINLLKIHRTDTFGYESTKYSFKRKFKRYFQLRWIHFL